MPAKSKMTVNHKMCQTKYVLAEADLEGTIYVVVAIYIQMITQSRWTTREQ